MPPRGEQRAILAGPRPRDEGLFAVLSVVGGVE